MFKKEIRDWWNKKLDHFIAKQAIQRGQPIAKVSGETLYAEGASDFLWMFLLWKITFS